MANDIKRAKFPSSAKYIIGNEAAERFTYYGMKAVLTTYLSAEFFATEKYGAAHANELTHTFIMLTYLMSIIGGILADSYLGKYKTILYLSLIYAAGNFLQAFNTTGYPLFITGLIFIAFGSGGIKPCVSANVGDQFDSSNQHLLTKMFGMFYFAINVGSMLSVFLTPVFKGLPNQHILGITLTGPQIAFGVPGVLMVVATFIFWLGRKKYVYVKPKKLTRINFINISAYALARCFKKVKGQSVLDIAKKAFPEQSVENTKSVWNVLAVFAFIPIFWALYDQNGSEWVLQATKMNLHLNLGFASFSLLPEQVQLTNPILILVFIPLFSYLIYPAMEKMGIKVTALRKIGVGMIFTLLTFIVIAHIQTQIDMGQHPNVAWQILAYTLLTAAEILISITGLEYAYTQAPLIMKSTVMACWLATVFFGDLFDTIVNKSIFDRGIFSHFTGARFYWLYFFIMAAFTLAYFIVSPRIKEKSYLVDEATEREITDSLL